MRLPHLYSAHRPAPQNLCKKPKTATTTSAAITNMINLSKLTHFQPLINGSVESEYGLSLTGWQRPWASTYAFESWQIIKFHPRSNAHVVEPWHSFQKLINKPDCLYLPLTPSLFADERSWTLADEGQQSLTQGGWLGWSIVFGAILTGREYPSKDLR